MIASSQPPSGTAPSGIAFPLGFLDFELLNVTPGGAATVTLTSPAGTTIDTYYKYGPEPGNTTPHWYEFLYDGTTGAEIVGNQIILHFVDGQRGDDDLTDNGVIVDPGAPGRNDGPDDPPVANINEAKAVQGGTFTFDDSLLAVTDADTHNGGLSLRITRFPEYGELLLNGQPLGIDFGALPYSDDHFDDLLFADSLTYNDILEGRFSYRHDGTTTTSDSFEFELSDRTTTLSPATFAISIVSTEVAVDGAGNLTVTDIAVENDDSLTIQSDGSQIIISDPDVLLTTSVTGASGNASHTITVPLSSFSGDIVLNPSTGNDTVTVDYSLGKFDRGITFNGSQSSGINSLVLTGGSFTDAVFNNSNEHDGSIQLDNEPAIAYFGLDPITSSIIADNITLNYSDDDETITVSSPGNGTTNVDSTAGEITTFANPTTSLTINAGGGDDHVDVQGLDASFSAHLAINGQSGLLDSINISAPVSTGGRDVALTASDEIVIDSTVATDGGNFTVNADSNTNGSGAFVQPIAGVIDSSDGQVSITASDVSIEGAISAGTGAVAFAPSQAGAEIHLGQNLATAVFSLSDVELDNVATTNKIAIGDDATGSVTIWQPINLSDGNAPLLEISSSGPASSISDANAAAPDVTVANLVLSGSVAPGDPLGVLSAAGNVMLTDDSTLQIQIGGTSPGVDADSYDQLHSSGLVTIGDDVSLTFDSFGGYVPSNSESFTIISRSGGSGVFAGLVEGEQVTTNFLGSGQPAFITYAGGDGHDVVLFMNRPPNAGDDVASEVSLGEDDGVTDITSAILQNDLDPDGDPLTVAEITDGASTVTTTSPGSITLASGAIVSLDNSGNVAFDPKGQFDFLSQYNSDANSAFDYTVVDAFGETDTATAAVLIQGANDSATISGSTSGFIVEDSTASVTGAMAVSDADIGENLVSQQSSVPGDFRKFQH